MPLRISVTGPESTGKSHLSHHLADMLGLGWVPEVARSYLNELERPYEEEDLSEILRQQLALESETLHHFPKGLVSDTDPLVLEVWSEFKYGRVSPSILQAVQNHRYHHYLIGDIDLPWEPDPLREHPDQREELLDLYISKCHTYNLPYTLISGQGKARNLAGQAAVAHLLAHL